MKRAEGNPGKRSLENVIELPPLKVFPKAPAGIGKYARQFWNHQGRAIFNVGLLTDVDLPAWQLLCESYQRMRTAQDKLGDRTMMEITPSGSKKHPLLAIIHQEYGLMAGMMKEFGMTPVSRERVRNEKGPATDELDDLMKAHN